MPKLRYEVKHKEDGSLLHESTEAGIILRWLDDYLTAHPEEFHNLSLKIYMGKRKSPLAVYEDSELAAYLDDNSDLLDARTED